ncbi:MAG: hypothetical protein WCI11_06805 [Candidatus Methylumidiphilus sp.]
MAIFPEVSRVQIGSEDAATLRGAGALIDDPRRQRPRYFDGRFLAARDLIRDQQYFLTREADLGRTTGSGVAEGLGVLQPPGAAQTLTIEAGHGITPSGELVRLEQAMQINIADLPRTEQLSAKFGLGPIPNPPLRSRTGLFALALRPVEYTANPVGAYPTSVTGQRVVEDGDIIEATAVILVPWQDDGDGDSLIARRGRVARTIFTQAEDRGLSANVLPLAMLALQNNILVWLDVPMLRRELGADRADLPGLGFAPRALRLAHLLQFQSHLDYVKTVSSGNYPASAWFPALPPAGPLPPNVVNPNDFTQSYFPAGMKVDFTIIPEDELPALVEESLALPPIDLTAPADTFDAIAVMVLAPVPRNEWRAVNARLTIPSGSLVRKVSPAATNLVAQRKPLEILQRLRLPALLAAPIDPSNPADAEWARLAGLGSLWFVRRRNLAYRDDLVGESVRFAGASSGATDLLVERINSLGLGDQLTAVLDKASPRASIEVKSLLASPRFVDSPALTAAAIGEFASAPALHQADALGVAAKLTAPNVGDGLLRLEQSTPTLSQPAALQNIAAGNGLVIDKVALTANNTEVPNIASRVLVNPSGIVAVSALKLRQ